MKMALIQPQCPAVAMPGKSAASAESFFLAPVTMLSKPKTDLPVKARHAPPGNEVEPADRDKGDEGRRSANRLGKVLDVLRGRISRHEVPPGAKLREQELAEEFGVPRTLIREVFSALEQRGLIERIPNHGAVVTRIDVEQLSQIYDIREVLEGLCVRLATQNTSAEYWRELVDYFDGPMVGYVANGDFDAYLAGYARFRQHAIQAMGNPVLSEIMDNLWDKTQVLVGRIVILPGRAQQGLAEHIQVIHAIRRGDAEAAESLRRQSMRNAKATLIRFQKFLL